jgi:hypothetical protein
MKPDDIIYIALICFVVAVVLWAYSDDISDKISDIFYHNVSKVVSKAGFAHGGSKKKKGEKGERPFKKYPKRSPFLK